MSPQAQKMAAALVNKAVIVNVRAIAHDHLRDHSCNLDRRRLKKQTLDRLASYAEVLQYNS